MARKIKKIIQDTRLARRREVRDLYNHLRKKYRSEVVEEFFKTHYFLQYDSVVTIASNCDNIAVNLPKASLIYRTAMSETFHL